MSASLVQPLSIDHRRLDASLAEVKRCVASGDRARAAAHFAEFRRRLLRHMQVEEDLLFPVFVRAAGAGASAPVDVMRLEHRQMEALLPSLAALLEGGDAATRITRLAELTVRLLAHHGKEDRVLYPMIERSATSSVELQELAPRIEAQLADPVPA